MPTAVRRRNSASVLVVAAAVLVAGCGPTSGPVLQDGPGVQDGPAAEDALAVFARANGLVDLPRSQVTVGTGPEARTFTVLVADTAASRARGLQGVTVMPDGVGMLFAFDAPPGPGGRPGFWMLDTLVPLDIAFAADGVVVGVATMTPCAARPCPITHPGVEYDVALEVAAGSLTRAGVAPGDAFEHRDSDAR